jgi:hypothetical protein
LVFAKPTWWSVRGVRRSTSTIAVSKETKRKLIKMKGQLENDTGDQHSMDDVISYLLGDGEESLSK